MIILATLLAAASFTAAQVPTPATAAAATPATTAAALPPVSKAPASPYAVRYDAKRNLYCVRDRSATPITGTRLNIERCRTTEAWADSGLTIARAR